MTALRNVALILLMGFVLLTTIPVSAQSQDDTAANLFHDDLLDHLVGKWSITSFAHGHPFTATLEGKWELHHQFFHIHFKGNEVVPWFGVPMEYEEYIGYNHKQKRYVVNGVSIEGADDYDGFCYAYRNGNEIKLMQKMNAPSKTTNIQRMIWNPDAGSWLIQSNPLVNGKEGSIFLDMKLTLVRQ